MPRTAVNPENGQTMDGAAAAASPGASALFGVADYVVFGAMLLLCAAIGVYFGFCGGGSDGGSGGGRGGGRASDSGAQEPEAEASVEDYLMGGRRMRTIPVAVSLIASYVSGITLLGIPTEIYLYGTQYVYVAIATVIMGLVLSELYLPTLHRLGLTSSYEYLELRFSKSVRIFGSLLFFIHTIIWLPIVMYVAALAFNQVTGIGVYVITPVVCIVCIFYTCVGGLKAVVWTDVLQSVAMFGSMVLVIAKGTADVGGVGVVWERAWDSGRIEAPNMSVDPTERHTLLVLVLGGLFHWLQSSGVSQMMMQRYLCLPTLTSAKIAVWLFVLGVFFLIAVCSYAGLLIYATYYDCDPLTTKLAKATDQLLPLLMMRSLGHLSGLPGCFIAGVFSAALSSMSTSLNSMAAVVLEDFYKTFSSRPLSRRAAAIFVRAVVVVTGALSVALVFVVEKLGTINQVALSLVSITNGPILGIFSMGLFLPWVNTKGAIAGGAVGLGLVGWVIMGTQAAIATGHITFERKPLSVEGCTYNYSLPLPLPLSAPVSPFDPDDDPDRNVFPLYRMSYLWYTMLGCVVSSVVGLVVSLLTGANKAHKVNPNLLSPPVAWLLSDNTPAPSAPPAEWLPNERVPLGTVNGKFTARWCEARR